MAIDGHLIPFTGTDRHNDSFVISGRPKGGTSRFETCITMQIVTEEQLPTIEVVRITEDTTKVEFVRKLLSESRKGIEKAALLTDRQFSNVDAMHFLDERDKRFLLAVSKTPGIKKGRLGVSPWQKSTVLQYEMRSNDGTAFRFRQVIKKCFKEKKGKRRWEYLMHATNLERRRIKRTMEDVPEEYKKLWGREQLQINRADPCPHLQPKSFDQSLYALSLSGRAQPAVYDSAKNERGDREQVGAACQKKYAS